MFQLEGFSILQMVADADESNVLKGHVLRLSSISWTFDILSKHHECNTFAIKIRIRFLLCLIEFIFCSEINIIFGLVYRPSSINC